MLYTLECVISTGVPKGGFNGDLINLRENRDFEDFGASYSVRYITLLT
jgi:hypothetical protein